MKNIQSASRYLVTMALVTAIYNNTRGQSPDQNYIHTYDMQVGITNISEIVPGISATAATQTIQYFDGLGRLKQTNQPSFTPDGKALIIPKIYNEVGLDETNYQPYYDNSNSNLYRDNYQAKLTEFYSNQFEGDQNGFSPIEFEKSPLNRVLKQGAPGSEWGLTHPIAYSYLTNNTTTTKLQAILWQIEEGVCKNNGLYESGELYVTKIVNEDLAETYEFKDKWGQVVLKRSILENDVLVDTYYVYDDYGLLRFVISPEGSKQISSGFISTDELAQQYVYCYTYDSRKRLIEKQIPGKEPEYFVYDKTDKLIMYQDGNMRKKKGENLSYEWMFTKYDALGRVIITGKTASYPNQSPNALQTLANTATNYWEYVTNPTTYPVADANYYTNQSFPYLDLNCEIYTINYYDNYSIYMKEGSNIIKKPIINQDNMEFDPYIASFTIEDPELNFVSGMLTASYVSFQGTLLPTATYYDIRGRIIQSRTKNHVKGTGISSNKYYGITNRVLNSYLYQSVLIDKNSFTHRENYTYTYDQAGRQLNREYKVGETLAIQKTENKYNALGQLIEKKIIEGSNLWQTINYGYNIRGWLTKINEPENVSVTGAIPGTYGDFFGMKLLYNTEVQGLENQSLYSGNISGICWQTVQPTGTTTPVTTGEKAYTYSYDKLNRLLEGFDSERTQGTWNGTGVYREKINAYDLNGNILGLRRHGIMYPGKATNSIDLLEYTYEGNRLIAVDDAISNNNGGDFYDNGQYYYLTHTQEYAYDANGNLAKDINKGIINISYNNQNLPVTLEKEGGTLLEYQYDAVGNKLRQLEYTAGKLVKTTDFVANFVYINGKTAWNSFDEGRIVYSTFDNTYYAENHLKDHLGNVRVAFAYEGSSLKIKQVNSYYPFGMNIKELSLNEGRESAKYYRNEYLYNGKMMQDEMGLGWLDYGARFYDPVIGRFPSTDPISESFYHVTPYNYAENEPVGSIDLWGLQRLRIAGNIALTSGKWGIKGNFSNLIGVGGSYTKGGVSQSIEVFLEIDTKTGLPSNIGISHTQKQIEEASSLEVGPIIGEISKEKETKRELSSKDGSIKTEDKKFEKKESGGFGPIQTNEENGTATSKLSMKAEVNAGILGVEAEGSLTYIKGSESKGDGNNDKGNTKSLPVEKEVKNRY